jgi:hypothetical protein
MGQRSREHVKPTAQNVDVSAGLNLKREGQIALGAPEYDIVCGWRFQLFDDHFSVFTAPSSELSFKEWDLGIGPIHGGLGVQEVSAHV